MDIYTQAVLLWLEAFFAFPENASFWSLLNSPILVSVIAVLIGWQLNQRIDAANSQAQIAAGVAEYSDQGGAFEEIGTVVVASSSDQRDFTDDIQEIAEKAKKFIEDKIKNDRDKRHARTYSKFSGHHPVARAVALRQRGRITDTQERELVNIIKTANRYNKGRASQRAAPEAAFEMVKASWKEVKSED